jgi:UDP-N-acetylglucosamine diphosphorylase / glucose-1-phosphate thymidylyltransferase / UDP-N-acetylgalactosamine diphosphorylase / glucosamine-1-phosphate N-acetyltransferase / galactosamine-1-phosphate N-acetyltransferase
MLNLILFDDPDIRQHLLPLTFTRPVAELRVGIQKIAEKWADFFQTKPAYLTQEYLQAKYKNHVTSDNYYVNGAVCPTEALVEAIKSLGVGEGLTQNGILLAVRSGETLSCENSSAFDQPLNIIQKLPDIFLMNGQEIRNDFARITYGRMSQPITDRFTAFYNESQIFIEEGAKIRAACLNAENGPIYIGKDALIQEGALVQGPFALCEGSTLNLGAKIRPNTTIGPNCKVGGEVSNVVFLGNSNKGHDGFLGNAVMGEWCNLGAATNNSNLKNDYSKVDLFDYAVGKPQSTGLQFCGLIMGDHSKSAIGTTFNTGTVVGVNANVFHAGLTPTHIPSFTWGGGENSRVYLFRKAVQVARATTERRGVVFDEIEEAILKTIYDQTIEQK